MQRMIESARWMSVGVAAFVSTVALAQQTTGEVLQRAIEAARSMQSLEMKAELKGEGGFAGLLPTGDATIKMARARDEGEVLFDSLVTGTIKAKADADEGPVAIRVLRTDEATISVQPEEKLVHELQGRGTRTWDGSLDLYVTPLTMATLSPYEREMAAAKIEYEGEARVSGEVVDVVSIEYEKDGNKATRGGSPLDSFGRAKWSFARSDGLPRRVEWIAGGAGLSFSLIVEYSDVKVNPGFDAASLAIETPEGYERRELAATETRTVRPSGRTGRRIGPPGRTDRESAAGAVRGAEPEPARTMYDEAPDFVMATADGEVVSKSTLAGQVSVFYFWGTWCVPCRAFSPLVSDLVETFEDEPVGVYGAAVRERNAQAPADYLAEKSYRHTLLLGEPDSGRVGADSAARAFKVRVYPSIVVVGAEGELVGFWRAGGGKSPEEIVGEVSSAVRTYLDENEDKLDG